MVYFTLFHLDLKNFISFDQYLAIASNLIDELLINVYDYILTARLQSDPIERRFNNTVK